MVALAWIMIMPWLAVLCVGVTYLLHRLDGDRGNHIGVGIILFVAVFCLVGAADAAWRYYLLMAVRHHYRSAQGQLNRSNPVVRLASRNGTTVLIQIAFGAFFAWRFS
jgi:hypothetical protein